MEELDLGQKGHQIAEARNSDGTINLTIVEVKEKGDNTVSIILRDPLGEEFTKTSILPMTEDEGCLLNDIFEYTGWEISTLMEIEGEDIPATRNVYGYTLLPEKKSFPERVNSFFNYEKSDQEPRGAVKMALFCGYPVIFFVWIAKRLDGWTNNYENGFMDGIIAVWLWILIFIFLLLII